MPQRSVLVIDDNAANRDLYVDLLEMTPFTALALKCGADALAMVRTHRPGLILMDINLPGRSGLEVAAEIFTVFGPEAPPILALTASCVFDLADRLKAGGFSGLVAKPCGVSTFLEAVTWGMDGAPGPFRVFSS